MKREYAVHSSSSVSHDFSIVVESNRANRSTFARNIEMNIQTKPHHSATLNLCFNTPTYKKAENIMFKFVNTMNIGGERRLFYLIDKLFETA